jgi:hypothetical protein
VSKSIHTAALKEGIPYNLMSEKIVIVNVGEVVNRAMNPEVLDSGLQPH